jgi:non-ribosomal peptide synthetase component F
MQATPITWRLLLEAGWDGKGLKKILCGGEAFPVDLANQLIHTPHKSGICMARPKPRSGQLALSLALIGITT